MTETFTASNGIGVEPMIAGMMLHLAGEVHMHLAPEEEAALREFFQHERDEELGRWRWPENPTLVVHHDKTPKSRPTSHTVVVIHEPSGDRAWAEPSGASSISGGTADTTQMRDAAAAYFRAFPPIEPKPWHGAKDGEVWVLTVKDVDEAWAVKMGAFRDTDGLNVVMPLDNSLITAGRRIWPEEK